MVKKIVFVMVLMLSAINSFAQCVESATGFGNSTDPDYVVLGDVTVNYDSVKNEISISTSENFSTASGPDVKVFLVNSEGKTTQELQNSVISELINIPFLSEETGDTIQFSGAQTLTVSVPNGVDLKDYDTVFFFCFRFMAFWDFGKITPIDTSTCSSLSFSNLEKSNNFKVSPNPVRDVLYLEGDLSKVKEYKVYNSVGGLVKQSEVLNNKINLSELPKGVYSLILISKTTFESEKIIKI